MAAGGAARLTQGGDKMLEAEGIETSLSLACGLEHNFVTIWAALSTGGMKALVLPPVPGMLTVATDLDDCGSGQAAAHPLAMRSDVTGWKLSFLPATNCQDWNDFLARKAQQANAA